MSREDWRAFVGHLDPAEAESYQRDELTRIKRHSGRAPTLEDVRRGDPEMPEEVALFELGRLQAFQAEWLPAELQRQFGTSSVDEISGFTAQELLARFLQYTDPRESTRRNAATNPGLRDLPSPLILNWEILGFVHEADSVVHGVYRVRWINAPEGISSSRQAEVITARFRGGRWSLDYVDMLGLERVYMDIGKILPDDEEAGEP